MEKSIGDYSLPPVSIIIVNYNGYKWLKLFIQHLLRTNYPNFEIIVVDNASSDQSVQFLRNEFRQIRIIELTENKGFAEGTNIGAKKATGKILAFLNNDIEVSNNWLFKAVTKLLSCDDAGAVQCKMMQYNDRNRIEAIGILVDRFAILRNIGYDEYDTGQYDNVSEIGAASGGAMILWKHIFCEVGQFDPLYFMYYEDIDLSWRIRLAGYRILPCVSSLVYHIGSGTSKRSSQSFITFHWTKNYLSCWLKNSSLKAIFLHWPVIVFYILGQSLFAAINGQPRVALSHFRATSWSFRHLRYIVRERKKVRSFKRKQGAVDNILFITGIVKDSSNLSYMMGRALRSLSRL
ncbi:MAG: glycosyltransferase family 2 protein [Nitrososphaeraceae archaeon]